MRKSAEIAASYLQTCVLIKQIRMNMYAYNDEIHAEGWRVLVLDQTNFSEKYIFRTDKQRCLLHFVHSQHVSEFVQFLKYTEQIYIIRTNKHRTYSQQSTN